MVLGLNNESEKIIFNDNSHEFIPAACHYDESTLLTKNGHLLQTIHIHGLGAETVSDELLNLRAVVRSAIREHIATDRFAFWVHTVRRKKDLDDPTSYSNEFSEQTHQMWRHKNFWHDKFVNSLYITVIHKKVVLDAKSRKGFLASLSGKHTKATSNDYLEYSAKLLSETTDALVESMSVLGAKKLGIGIEGENVFSELLYLYHRIVHLNEEKIYIAPTDFSYMLSTHRYAVGGDKLEVSSGDKKKFAALLSFREYQEFSAGSLDKLLQLPVEMIATEVFHFVSQDEAEAPYKYQNYVLSISGDERLREVKGVADLFNADSSYATAFCNQQISITLMADSPEKLDDDIATVSEVLSDVGVVHVREDINLEAMFWSQLPGNFALLRRVTPTNMEATCALASLHNFPTGSQDSAWGRAITLLRTEKGTPYFMNFHNEDGIGHTCILGHHSTGKTVTTNFFVSEAFKYQPAVCYVTTDNASQLFTEVMEGEWHNEIYGIDPLKLFRSRNQELKFKAFIEILTGHAQFENSVDTYINGFTGAIWGNAEIGFLEACTQWQPAAGDVDGERFAQLLQAIASDEFAQKLFTDSDVKTEFAPGHINAFNLEALTQQVFYDHNYSTERKAQDAFMQNIRQFDEVRSSYAYVLINHFLDSASISDTKKICVFENLHEFLTNPMFVKHLNLLYGEFSERNGLVLSNVNLNEFVDWSEQRVLVPIVSEEIYDSWFSLNMTEIFLGADVHIPQIARLGHLSEVEVEKLQSVSLNSRLFVIRQDGYPIMVELSLGGVPSLLRVLSCSSADLELAMQLRQQYEDTTQWLSELKNVLETN